jgi:NADH-ubiquinone oxidoreductase chain 1
MPCTRGLSEMLLSSLLGSSISLWFIIILFIIFFFVCTRVGIYTVIIAGWSSNSSYSLLDGLRALAQTISYKVRLSFILHSFAMDT